MTYVCTSHKLTHIAYGEIVTIDKYTKGSGFIINNKYRCSLYDVEDFFCPSDCALARKILSSAIDIL